MHSVVLGHLVASSLAFLIGVPKYIAPRLHIGMFYVYCATNTVLLVGLSRVRMVAVALFLVALKISLAFNTEYMFMITEIGGLCASCVVANGDAFNRTHVSLKKRCA